MEGLIIVYPHSDYIANGSKKLIIKSKYFPNIVNRPLLLIQKKEAIGIIYIDQIREINLTEFHKEKNEHLITEEERKKWWPNKNKFYEYHISKKQIFAAPVPIEYSMGPQVFIKLDNIKQMQKIHIGTSGYSYKWWGEFYEHKSKSEDQLQIYSENFNSLEINGTFYKQYAKKTYEKLFDSVPKDFVFAVKVNRSITHYYQFQKFNKFWQTTKVLTPKLKCLLFQFPEHFKYTENNMERLRKLNTEIKCAFEFRDEEWFNEEVYKLFKSKKHWTIVISYHGFKWSDKSNLKLGFNPSLNDWPVTSDFVYIRMHGTTDKYEGSHKRILPKLAKFIRELYKEGVKEAFVFFNNTDSLHNSKVSDAIVDAKYLQKIIGTW